MRNGRPSLTATWVAAWRGLLGIAPGAVARDPIAEQLVPMPYGAILRAAKTSPRTVAAVAAIADAVSNGRSQHIIFRTRAIDDAVAHAASNGARQLVLLGAGLDARAFRMQSLTGVRVFEVDHPATQSWKRARVGGAAAYASDVRFVQADFEEDHDLVDRLRAAGHDSTQKSVYVMEGVSMYLSSDGIDRALGLASETAAPGSSLVMTYFEPVSEPLAGALTMVLGRVREPVKSAFTPSTARERLSKHAFEVTGDEGDPEWRPRFSGKEQSWSLERLVRGVRR